MGVGVHAMDFRIHQFLHCQPGGVWRLNDDPNRSLDNMKESRVLRVTGLRAANCIRDVHDLGAS